MSRPGVGLGRAWDLALAIPALAILSPLLATIALAIRLDSPGPALFRQVRIGRNGRPFRLVKFRTMSHRPGPDPGTFAPGDRSRVTRVGRFLRATKLDELPQLAHVVLGGMALVGPRPEVPDWVEVGHAIDPDRSAVVLAARPGLTDPASLAFRDEEATLAAASDPIAHYRDAILPAKLALQADYLATRTAWTDLAVLARTLLALAPRRTEHR